MRVLLVLLALATTPLLASVSLAQAGSDQSEFSGTIEAIAAPNLTVAGRTVVTDANTEIERDDVKIGLADLNVGEVVEVEGTPQADGSILAREIQVQTGEQDGQPPPPPPPPLSGASITGTVFNNIAGRPGLPGWTVVLGGTVSATTITDAAGHYAFTGLPAGNYTVCEVVPIGWSQVSPGPGFPSCGLTGFGYAFPVIANSNNPFLDFGNIKLF